MNRGDVLFRVLDGKLEQVVFVEESLNPDCSVPTWLVRDACKRVRCSRGSYVESEKEAWEKYLKELKISVSEAKRAIDDAEEEWVIAKEEVARVHLRLMNLGGEVRVKDVFACPVCGSHLLDEVMNEVMQTTEVTGLALTEGGVACEYGDCSHDGGFVINYLCGVCGFSVAEDEAGLVKFLRQNQEE
jgi:rubrerythrin